MGLTVSVETNAGTSAAISDSAYEQAGASIESTPNEVLKNADIVIKVQKPVGPVVTETNLVNEINLIKDGAVLACLMEPYRDRPLFDAIAKKNITCFKNFNVFNYLFRIFNSNFIIHSFLSLYF